jgi:hypothetical protein
MKNPGKKEGDGGTDEKSLAGAIGKEGFSVE